MFLKQLYLSYVLYQLLCFWFFCWINHKVAEYVFFLKWISSYLVRYKLIQLIFVIVFCLSWISHKYLSRSWKRRESFSKSIFLRSGLFAYLIRDCFGAKIISIGWKQFYSIVLSTGMSMVLWELLKFVHMCRTDSVNNLLNVRNSTRHWKWDTSGLANMIFISMW